jgi:hypothetical protein
MNKEPIKIPQPQSTRGGARPNAGRSPKPIDLAEVEILAACGGTDDEIGYRFDLERSTITRRRQNDKEFAEVVERGKARGRISLRRKQFELAMKGDRTMLIWLGKNLLGQRDHFDGKLTVATLSIRDLSDEQLAASISEAQASGLLPPGPERPEETADKKHHPPMLETPIDVPQQFKGVPERTTEPE